MTSATKTCPWNYLSSSDSTVTHPGCPCSQWHALAGWLARHRAQSGGSEWPQPIGLWGDFVHNLGLKSIIITGLIHLGSHFRLLKSELLVFEVFEACFIWLISCSCIQQILVEHLLCASAKHHKQALHSLQAPITVAGRWTVTHQALRGF